MAYVDQIVENTLHKIAQTVEQQLDDELERLDKLDVSDLEKLREERLKALQKEAEQQKEWRFLGHGEYTEIPAERDFFGVIKKSTDVVCHFYKRDTRRCEIVDHHLQVLCISHLEAKFCKIDVERCPFLTRRLNVRVIPTIVLIKDNKVKDYIVGFTDLGNCDNFSSEMMEWRIAHAGVIKYNGNLLEPPVNGKKISRLPLGGAGKKRTIRGNDDDSDGDDF